MILSSFNNNQERLVAVFIVAVLLCLCLFVFAVIYGVLFSVHSLVSITNK